MNYALLSCHAKVVVKIRSAKQTKSTRLVVEFGSIIENFKLMQVGKKRIEAEKHPLPPTMCLWPVNILSVLASSSTLNYASVLNLFLLQLLQESGFRLLKSTQDTLPVPPPPRGS